MQLSVRSKFPKSALWGLQHTEDGNVSVGGQEGWNGTHGLERLALPVELDQSPPCHMGSTAWLFRMV